MWRGRWDAGGEGWGREGKGEEGNEGERRGKEGKEGRDKGGKERAWGKGVGNSVEKGRGEGTGGSGAGTTVHAGTADFSKGGPVDQVCVGPRAKGDPWTRRALVREVCCGWISRA
eukprot:363316-Chlamydomonas_euryale.AAC.9